MPVAEVICRDGALWPRDLAAEVEIGQWPQGTPIDITWSRTRQVWHHRLSWKMFGLIADALKQGPGPSLTSDEVKDALLAATGRGERVETSKKTRAMYRRIADAPDDAVVVVIKTPSTAFDKMDHDTYVAFIEDAKTYLLEQWPWLADSEQHRELRRILQARGR